MKLVLVKYFMYDNILVFLAIFLFFEIYGIFENSSSNPELLNRGRIKNLRHEVDLRKKSTFLETHQNIVDFHNLLYQLTTQIENII